ncbi:uncharacterized protein L3040_002750 [Drepanopeziza brunnea f. sp. 'multigermtubi']|uniref:uncharacterized protein n=1 Tax=Drepanopeziza brunnea f. sp. 'multigermtubi' TaxID=698441 RepID=UPI0023957CFD|nr:hypothetical protein L3040_002750 [Drepanopeziza brunnea f. sp. 'multigermtubi']
MVFLSRRREPAPEPAPASSSDNEKQAVPVSPTQSSNGSGSNLDAPDAIPDYKPENVAAQNSDISFWTKNGCTRESFKRRIVEPGENPLNQTMKPRHLNMIAAGGSIGAGLFVGSGKALATGGPGALLVDFLIVAVMVFNVVYALGELAVMYPVSGGFYTYTSRFVDPTLGFATGWNYVFQWAIVLPLELVVASVTVSYWNDTINPAVFVAIFLVTVVLINVFGTLGYAESEFWAACLKLGAIVIFMIIALVLVLGGGPSDGKYGEYWGARLWHEDGGPFKNGFKGICSVFITAAFSFSGTELVGLAAAESANPAKALPGAIKQIFYRITMFYIFGLFFVGLLVSANDPRLIGSKDPNDSKSSPFVIIGQDAALYGYNHFMNAVILISVISIGMSGVYGGSRTLCALSEQGYAPKLFSYIDKSGRPLFAVIVFLICGLIGFVNCSASGQTIFDWLQALSGLAVLLTWASICLAHIRFRAAWRHQGHTVDEIPFRAVFGVYGSIAALAMIMLVLMAQFYVALYPFSANGHVGNAEDFFKSMLGLPVVIFFFVCGYFWKKPLWLTLDNIDLDTGRREIDWNLIRAERQRIAGLPLFKRMYYFCF